MVTGLSPFLSFLFYPGKSMGISKIGNIFVLFCFQYIILLCVIVHFNSNLYFEACIYLDFEYHKKKTHLHAYVPTSGT